VKCKTCGKGSESEYCFRCKPRKPLAQSRIKPSLSFKKKVNGGTTQQLHEFFRNLWAKKKHYCENCGEWLGNEPLSYHFDHLLEKNKHPDLKFEEENIMMVCLECHDNKTRGNLTDFVRHKIEEVRKRFDK